MTTFSRRNFLKAGGAGILTLSLPIPGGYLRSAFAGEEGTPSLVVIYLRGGMDALNAVIPYKDKQYGEMRPTLAIPEDDVVKLDKRWGLHPALGALKPLWDDGVLSPVINCGSPHATRSHFDAQDFMEYAAPGLRTVRDGWLNRYLEQTKKRDQSPLRGLAMQGLLPRALRGNYPALAVPERDVLENAKVLEAFGELYGEGMGKRKDDMVLRTGRYTAETLEKLRRIIQSKGPRGGTPYPAGRLGAKMRAIAQVIKSGEGLEVAALDLGGWDTHANQGRDTGVMPNLMKNLSEAIAAFARDLGPHLKRTLVVTMTEFGRTCKENGNYGTDHGHGGMMLLMGGGLKGGQVHGKWTGLKEGELYQARDLKVTTDFRDVFAEILKNHFRMRVPKGFFPDYRPTPVRGLFA